MKPWYRHTAVDAPHGQRPIVRAIAALALTTAMLLAWRSTIRAAELSQMGSDPQVNQGGQVTVSVTWAGTTEAPTFRVVLDTHAVNLDSYDLTQLATLRTADGEIVPTGWDAPPGGHHREGVLRFASVAPDSNSMELVIRDVAGVPERTFSWTW